MSVLSLYQIVYSKNGYLDLNSTKNNLRHIRRLHCAEKCSLSMRPVVLDAIVLVYYPSKKIRGVEL